MTPNHVHLASTRVEDTVAFYERFFGFFVSAKHGAGFFLRNAEGFLIALDPTETPHEFPAWFHLGFCLSSERAVHELHAVFGAAGIEPVRKLLAEPGEHASFYVQDPDGVRIEVSWHAE